LSSKKKKKASRFATDAIRDLQNTTTIERKDNELKQGFPDGNCPDVRKKIFRGVKHKYRASACRSYRLGAEAEARGDQGQNRLEDRALFIGARGTRNIKE